MLLCFHNAFIFIYLFTYTNCKMEVAFPRNPGAPSTAPLKGYMVGKSPATQNIALLLMLREWRAIAQAARARREQLHQMWSSAVVFHRESLTRRSLMIWKRQLGERPDLRAPEAKCRMLVSRYTVNQMRARSDVQQRLRLGQRATRLWLLTRSLDKWRSETQQIVVQSAHNATSRADLYNEFYLRSMAINIWRHRERSRRDSLLQSRALRDLVRRDKMKQRRLVLLAWREVVYRNRMMEERADRMVARRTETLAARCLKGWRQLAGARRHNDAQTMTSMLADDEEKQMLLRRVREAETEVQRYRETGGIGSMLEGWRKVARHHGKNLRMAASISQGSGQSLGIRVLTQWRAASRSIRQMDQTADNYSRQVVLHAAMSGWNSRLVEVREMDERADQFMTEDVIQRFAMVLIETRYNRRQESSPADEQPLADAEEEEESVTTEPLAIMDLEMYFGKWRQLAGEMREVQNTMIDRLPDGMRSRVVGRLNRGDPFNWELLYSRYLLETSLAHWQQVLTADDEEEDAEVGQLEQIIAAKHEQLARNEAVNRWLVVLREKLWDEDQLPKVFEQFLTRTSERAKIIRLSKAKERINLLQLSINRWWQAHFINQESLDNADTQADGNLAHSTLMHWRDQIHSNHSTEEQETGAGAGAGAGTGMYMRALAFRWDKQIRHSMLRWMQASKNEQIKVRLAQNDPERERRLMEVGEQHYRMLVIKQVWERLQMEGRRRRLRQRMRMRLADAWSDANIRQQTIGWWRERTNPERSMEISVIH